ncbi:hypothetical protein [Paenibacillus sp. P22]|uniref:hypothetical protein n=1 Tax=Paenibacillus sp. P22 TaxID=483908 RepID=UPI001E6359AF|nr:hypothetical protein [Paenibacillus sp. P22]
MEAKDAVKDIRAGRIAPVYAVFGKDRYRMSQFATMLTEKLLAPDERELGIVRYDMSETSLEEIIGEAETLPFFCAEEDYSGEGFELSVRGGKGREGGA